MTSAHRDIVARINLDALRHNVALLRSACRQSVRLCAALKANAYGHGVKVVAPALDEAGAGLAALGRGRI